MRTVLERVIVLLQFVRTSLDYTKRQSRFRDSTSIDAGVRLGKFTKYVIDPIRCIILVHPPA
jgi:hypothetical protein